MKTKILEIGMLVLLVLSTATSVVNAVENRSDVFINSYIDNTRGFYSIEPFYVNFDTHQKVSVNMVTVTPTSVVLNQKVVLEWVNTVNVPLTIEMKDSISGNVVFKSTIEPGYEYTYTIDTTRVYDVYIEEYPNLEHQKIVASVDGSEPPVVVTSQPSVVVTPIVINHEPINMSIDYAKPTNITHIGAIITPITTPVNVDNPVTTYVPSPVTVVYPAETYAPASDMVYTFGRGTGMFFGWLGRGIWDGLNS